MPFSLLEALSGASRSEARWEILGMALAAILVGLGLGGLALFAIRRRSRDRSLLYLCVFCILYGARLFFRQDLLQSLLFTAPVAVRQRIEHVIDCFIAVPFTLFLMQIIQPQWKRALAWVLSLQIVFGALWLLSSTLHIGQHFMDIANSTFVVLYCGLIAIYYFVARTEKSASRDLNVVSAGLAVFALFAIEGNLGDLGVLPRHRSVEAIGFFLFVCCLGTVAARRTLAREERLLALNKELQIANQIQNSILPREVPRLAGLEIAARYLPMSDVAGDFYDFLPADDRHLGVLVADVTGHGVPAALIASMLKVAFAGQSAHAEDPAQVLSGLNRALCGKFEDHFVTAAYVFVDLERFTLRYAGAGHPPPIVATRNGAGSSRESREIEANGLMLGLFPEATYTSVEIPLSEGDRILFYTDGIAEAMNAAREEFGKARLKRFLSETSCSASELVDALLVESRRWSGSSGTHRQDDDITLVLLDFPAA
jgi:phosphoserine phosphatase RsbU/P